MKCPECEYCTGSTDCFMTHLRRVHSTTPALAGIVFVCKCGHESQSNGHEKVCKYPTEILKSDEPIRRLADPKITPKCFLCEEYPSTVYGYVQHLRIQNRTTLAKNPDSYLSLKDGISSLEDSSTKKTPAHARLRIRPTVGLYLRATPSTVLSGTKGAGLFLQPLRLQLNIIVIEVDEELLKKNENPKLFWLAYLKKDIDDEPDVVHTVTKKELRPLMRKERDCLSARNVERPTSMNEALSDMGNDDGSDALEEGWALPSKRKSGHYSEKAKAFVEKKFNEGAKTGKIDAAECERLMKEESTIKPSERMNAQQIRLKREESDQFECEEDLSEEDVEVIDDFGRQKDDVLDDLISENRNELFTDPKNDYMGPDL
ncbi:hypothetical protein PRIPAC_97790 [Pristionchus pacificus]|uniref:Uncharacterized protein n=1 Tax=Pristionchus pacificus TaxID=54126 RepID=A0A2A6D392_PRIPA|nr:hypothetical protein PRIPAC_97790 [Pristionchus pacificus]|eukprot:PDM84830.1 hypothetical protein PRIPAC_33853 [Pristionchus pacificus]